MPNLTKEGGNQLLNGRHIYWWNKNWNCTNSGKGIENKRKTPNGWKAEGIPVEGSWKQKEKEWEEIKINPPGWKVCPDLKWQWEVRRRMLKLFKKEEIKKQIKKSCLKAGKVKKRRGGNAAWSLE